MFKEKVFLKLNENSNNPVHEDLPFDEAAEAEPQDRCGDQVLVRDVFLLQPLRPPPPAGGAGESWTGADSNLP